MSAVAAEFSHADPGTPEESWLQDGRLARLPRLAAPGPGDHLVVLGAHPDDETLGAGGLIAAAVSRGAEVDVLVATDGEGSHPRSTTVSPRSLASRRRRELAGAMKELGEGVRVTSLGLPDGRLTEHRRELEGTLATIVRPGSTVVTPWRADRHPDHEVCSYAARALLRRVPSAHHWQYPIWAWHWTSPVEDVLPWHLLGRVDLPETSRAAKQRALACHQSQHEPLSRLPGDEVLLHGGFLAHFARPFEAFVVEPPHGAGDPTYFEALYEDSDDPWGLRDRFYEQRKREVLMASLPGRRFERAFEPGCATGHLTELLAARCNEVVACDAVERAVELAASRTQSLPNVSLSRRIIPDDWPRGLFDLVVISEVGYYCDDASELASAVRRSLAPGGCVVGCHWRRPAADHPRSATEVHEALGEGLHTIARHVEEDFLLEVWSADPRSVAARTGITT